MFIPLTSQQAFTVFYAVVVVFGIALLVIALSNDFRGSTRFLARVALRLCLLAYLAYGAFVLWVAAHAVDKPRGDGFGLLAALFLTRWGLRQIIVALLLLGIFEWALRRFAPQSLEWVPDEKSRDAKAQPMALVSQAALGVVWVFGFLLVVGGMAYAWKAYDDYRLAAVERRLARFDHGNTPFERASYDPDSPYFVTVQKERATIWSRETHLPVDMGTLRRGAAYYLRFQDERGGFTHYAAGVRNDPFRWGPGIYSLDLYDIGRSRAVSPVRVGEHEHVIDAIAVPGPQQEVLVLTDQALLHWSIPRGKLIRRVAHDLKDHQADKFRHEPYHELVVSPDGARAAFVAADINLMIVPLSRPQDDVIELAPWQLGKAGGVSSGVRKLSWRREIQGLLFSPDGARLYVGRPDGLLGVDAATGAIVARTTSSGPCVPRFDNLYMRPEALTEDGYIVVQTAFAVACVIDRHTFAPVREISRRGYRPIPDPDHRIRFKDSRVEVEDLDTAAGDAIAVSADGARVAISSPQIDRTLVFDTATGALVAEVCPFHCRALERERREDPPHIALSSDGAILLVSGDAGHAAWHVATGAHLFALDDGTRPGLPASTAKK